MLEMTPAEARAWLVYQRVEALTGIEVGPSDNWVEIGHTLCDYIVSLRREIQLMQEEM